MNALGRLDWIGLVTWAVLWLGYALWADQGGGRARSLMVSIALRRRAWMREAYRRENRITDVGLIGSLMQSATFFSSTTLLILGGLFAVLGTIEKSAEVLQGLPFAARTTQELLEIKALALTLVFIYAFLRFTWSLRQFNLLSILIGGAPLPGASEAEQQSYVRKAGLINSFAGDDFNRGVRAYYFALAALTWLIQPVLFLLVTTAVVIVLYRRDYRSRTLAVVSGE